MSRSPAAPASGRGLLDLAGQMAILAAAYFAWRLARGAVDGSTAVSMAHARDLISAERFLHSFVELDVQRWVVSTGWVSDVTGWLYGHLHMYGSLAALLYIWFAHNRSFRFVRNAVIAAMAISLLGYLLFPTAPPRFVDGLGFSTARDITGNEPIRASGSLFFNPYAAVPSMHVGLAAIFGFSLARLSSAPLARAGFAAYPLLVTFVVVATGNHFWLDALFGALTAVLALAAAASLARLRPLRWSLQGGAPATEAPGGEEPAIEAAPA